MLGLESEFKMIHENWKTPSIYRKMEDNFNFVEIEDDHNCFKNGR